MKKKTPAQLARLLSGLTVEVKDKSGLEKAIRVFLDYLRKERSLSKLPYIIKSFQDYQEEKEGKIKVSIKSSKKLDNK